MNIWHDIDPAEITPTDFTAVIEIPKGSSCKYELDKKTGIMRLDRVLYTATHYPANYGFIPRTYADDGDPLDVLVLCGEAIYPMTLVQVYPIGCMRMIDGGKEDDKIIAIPFSDPTYRDVKSIDELPAQFIVSKNSNLKCLPLYYSGETDAEDAPVEEQYAICVTKGNTELLDAINEVLNKMMADGEIEKLVMKHMGME